MNPADAKRLAQDLQLLRSDALQPAQFHGLSMLPFLQDGDHVTVAPVRWREIRRGDIITYRDRSKYPTRRVVQKHRDRLILWCDNWPELRFMASRDDVLGRVVLVERAGAQWRPHDEAWRAATARALAAYRRSLLRRVWRGLRRRVGSVLVGRLRIGPG
jgi:hypothetical protein